MKSTEFARAVLPALAVSFCIACADAFSSAPLGPPVAPPAPPQGSTLFSAVFNALQSGSMRRDSVDWPALRATAESLLVDSSTYAGAYPAISRAIQGVADNHSWFRTASGGFLSIPRTLSCGAPTVATPEGIPNDIGYVRVRAFSGTPLDAQYYADDIRAQIALRDSPDIAGWIIDLRGNGGGNMWPMLAALHPFLDDTVGFFFAPRGMGNAWLVQRATSFVDAFPLFEMGTGVYIPVGSMERVAVLTDARVASSGEATAIAFRQRPQTRFFGTPTCGISTAVQSLAMPGGHLLGLTSARMADRNRVVYWAGVTPDELITDPEATLTRAIEWLRTNQ